MDHFIRAGEYVFSPPACWRLTPLNRYIKSLEQRVAELELASKEKDLILSQFKTGATTTETLLDANKVPVEKMSELLTQLNAKVSHPAVLERAKEIANGITGGEDEDDVVRNKLRAVNEYVISQQREFFESHNVDGGFEFLHTHHVPHESLKQHIDEFREIEERVVVIAALGQTVYDRNRNEEAEIAAIQEQIEAIWDGGDVSAKQALVAEIRTAANKVFQTKLNQATSQRDMMRIYETLDKEERTAMMRAEVLQRIIGAQQHGHSHGGEPCHGHGGHDEDDDEEEHSHSHSHGGQPCHGHGGHDEESEESDDEEEHSHSHSHGGQPCHGHGH